MFFNQYRHCHRHLSPRLPLEPPNESIQWLVKEAVFRKEHGVNVSKSSQAELAPWKTREHPVFKKEFHVIQVTRA